MRTFWLVLAALAASFGVAGGAFAQGAIQQSGAVVPFHAPAWVANGTVADGGAPATPYVSALGLFNGGYCPFGVSSQPGPGSVSTPYSRFTICQTSTTTTLTLSGVNGQPTPSLNLNIGGTIYPFPGPGNGNVLGPSSAVSGNLACFNTTAGTLLKDCGSAPALSVTTYDSLACSGYPHDALAGLNAARDHLTYTNGSSAPSGGIITAPGGCNLYLSAPFDMSAKNGLQLLCGAGVGDMACQLDAHGGNYPLVQIIGSYTTPTVHTAVSGFFFNCGGKANASAYGVKAAYVNTARVNDNYFVGCKHGVDVTGAFMLVLDHNRWDGTGSQQNETCVYAHVPTDVLDAFHNNAIVATSNICQNYSLYGLRGEDIQGSIFTANQWLGGTTGVYLCDLSSATFVDGLPSACQFGFFNGDQVDSTSSRGWVIKKGAAVTARLFKADGPWAGNTVTDAFDIEGIDAVQINNALTAASDNAFHLVAVTHFTITGQAYAFNQHSDGSAMALLDASTDGTISLKPVTGSPLVGYNGISEINASARNQFFGAGLATCTLGTSFGGAATGITYSAQGCQYEVEGNTVHLQFLNTFSSKGSATGSMLLTGLPITAQNGANSAFGNLTALGANSVALPQVGPIMAQPVLNTTTVNLYYQNTTGLGPILDTYMTNTSTVTGQLNYYKQ